VAPEPLNKPQIAAFPASKLAPFLRAVAVCLWGLWKVTLQCVQNEFVRNGVHLGQAAGPVRRPRSSRATGTNGVRARVLS